MVGTQRSRVWWVHSGAGYGGYTGAGYGGAGYDGYTGAGYDGYTEQQGMVGTQRSRV